MSREPDLEAVNRALSVTVQKQERELAQLTAILRWIAEQVEAWPDTGAVSIMLAEIGSRVRLVLTDGGND